MGAAVETIEDRSVKFQSEPQNSRYVIHRTPIPIGRGSPTCRIVNPALWSIIVLSILVQWALKGRRFDAIVSGITVTNSVHSLFASKLLGAPIITIAQTISDYSNTPTRAYSKWKQFGWSGQAAAVKALGDWASSWASTFARALICVSQPVADAVIKAGFPSDRVRVTGNGVLLPLDLIAHPTKEFEATFLGRIVREKGIMELLQAWASVTKRMNDARLCVIGEGDFLENSEEFVEVHHLRRNVVFMGFVPERQKYSLLSKSKLLVFPSLSHEGWGMAITEALACGVPVVAFDNPVISNIFGANSAVVLVPNNDMDALAKTITHLLEDDDYLKNLGVEAKESAKQYDWDNIAQRELWIIEEVVRRQ